MKKFRINDRIEIVCEFKKTRYGFRHEATLILEGQSYETVKVCYQNRTWEVYEYQSVMYALIEKTKNLLPEEKQLCSDFIRQDHTDWSGFRTTAMVAMIGDVLCDSKKEKNDWKARMLKAGLGNMGLEIPEDWDTLDEDTKQKRLDSVIGLIKSKGEKQNEKKI